MPRGGADARARQCAALYGLAHEQAVAPALGKLLDALVHYGKGLPRDSDDACLIRVARRDFQKKIKIPSDHVARANAHGSASYNTWTRARSANDFAAMVPYLKRTLDLSREYSSYFAPYKHVADPHIDDADEGMTTASIRKLFSELKGQLVPMVAAICEQPVTDDSSLRQAFPKAAQFEFALNLAQQAHPDIPREIARGEFSTLHTWLRDNVYQHGSKFAPNDLVERVTDTAMSMTPYLGYLREKYAALYWLPESLSTR